jgi:twitching motility two-component system response regulator PilG
VSELDLTGLKVVVVDDSKTIQRTAEVLLGEQGCWVVTASDGFESLAKIASFKPDVIFVDVMMPRLDGYQTCALIKANRQYRDIPVIMLSSKDSIFDMARGRLAGSDKYLTKPFTKQDLLSAIKMHVKLEATPATQPEG